jgi:hypothetical protein
LLLGNNVTNGRIGIRAKTARGSGNPYTTANNTMINNTVGGAWLFIGHGASRDRLVNNYVGGNFSDTSSASDNVITGNNVASAWLLLQSAPSFAKADPAQLATQTT